MGRVATATALGSRDCHPIEATAAPASDAQGQLSTTSLHASSDATRVLVSLGASRKLSLLLALSFTYKRAPVLRPLRGETLALKVVP